jgi:hypothetical protein
MRRAHCFQMWGKRESYFHCRPKLVNIPKSMRFPVDAVRLEN